MDQTLVESGCPPTAESCQAALKVLDKIGELQSHFEGDDFAMFVSDVVVPLLQDEFQGENETIKAHHPDLWGWIRTPYVYKCPEVFAMQRHLLNTFQTPPTSQDVDGLLATLAKVGAAAVKDGHTQPKVEELPDAEEPAV